MSKIIIIGLLLAMLMVSGCAGLGTEKKTTVMPDEVWVSVDVDPHQSGRLSEITGGVKWKLK